MAWAGNERRWRFPWYAKAITHVVPVAWLPFTRDQVVMAEADNVCDLAKFEESYGWMPRGFEATLRGYVENK